MFFSNSFTRGAAAFALLGSLTLTACDSGEPDGGPGEEELINQVSVTLTNTADASDTVTITGTASDGLVIDSFSPASVALRAGATYDGTIELRDTINDEDIGEEVAGEAEEHLLRYLLTPTSAGTVTLTDTESDYTTENENGGDFAVGLTFRASVASSAAGLGSLTAILYHFDDAPKTGSSATSDEIDVDVDFPVTFVSGATAQ